MTESLQFLDDAQTARGVTERRFVLQHAAGHVPGVFWCPENVSERRPIILLGHGASLHKRVGYILAMARRFVRHHGFCAVAIDGPGHGERRPDGGMDPVQVFSEFGEIWSAADFVDRTITDWRATLDALSELPSVDASRAGYWGLSMGTILGLPTVVAEPRIRVAVLGLMGTVGPTAERLAADAARLQVPVMMLQQWHDELIPRDTVSDLFDRIASPERSLHCYPGLHAEVPAVVYGQTEAFVASHLADG